MGELEKKNEERGEDKKKEIEAAGKKIEEELGGQEIVLKVDMHCEACARKVAKSLKGFQGVEEVRTDCKGSKVVVKAGKTADPIKVCDRIQKKAGRKVELISPKPPPQAPTQLDDDIFKDLQQPKQPQPNTTTTNNNKQDPPPVVVTIVLKVGMYCEACAQLLQKTIRKIPGVESATADLANEQVTVKGIVEPEQLVNDVYKRTKKQACIVNEEEKKVEEEAAAKKEEEKKKLEEKQVAGENKDGGDQAGKGSEEADDHAKFDIQNSEYWPSKYHMEYAQCFSDDNPNACSLM